MVGGLQLRGPSDAHEEFYSLGALNQRIVELLQKLNNRPMKGFANQSRRQMFEQYDLPHLKPLPLHRYEYAEWKKSKVNIDYHIAIDGHYYSVPCQYARQAVDVRISQTTIEIFSNNRRLASHRRSFKKGRHSTISEHMPKSHRAHGEWTPSRIIAWGKTIGPNTGRLVEKILQHRPHPEMGYRSCLGILRLSKKYGQKRLENACERTLAVNAHSYRHVHSVLKNGFDKVPLEQPLEPEEEYQLFHDNIRGSDYYQ